MLYPEQATDKWHNIGRNINTITELEINRRDNIKDLYYKKGRKTVNLVISELATTIHFKRSWGLDHLNLVVVPGAAASERPVDLEANRQQVDAVYSSMGFSEWRPHIRIWRRQSSKS